MHVYSEVSASQWECDEISYVRFSFLQALLLYCILNVFHGG